MAANDLFGGVAGWLLGEAVGYDLAAPMPSAPLLLRHGTHGGCDWFTGICSVPDRATWLATGTDRTASCRRGRRRRHRRSAGAMGGDVTDRRPAHRGGSGVAGPWADAVWDGTVLKAPRNWLRKASIGSSGAEGPGSSPSCQPQGAICLNTEGSRAMIEITTLWLAPGPVMGVAGCSSPSRMSTRFGSLSSVTHEVRACSEYWIDRPKNWRTVLALRQTVIGDSLRAGMGSKIEALPTLFQGTMVGNGAEG